MNEFCKVSGYKVNTQKIVAILQSKKEQSENEIMKTTPFTIPPKRIKYFGIN